MSFAHCFYHTITNNEMILKFIKRIFFVVVDFLCKHCRFGSSILV